MIDNNEEIIEIHGTLDRYEYTAGDVVNVFDVSNVKDNKEMSMKDLFRSIAKTAKFSSYDINY